MTSLKSLRSNACSDPFWVALATAEGGGPAVLAPVAAPVNQEARGSSVWQCGRPLVGTWFARISASIPDTGMIDIEEAKRILAAFERESVEYVMVGSMAMAAQGLVRATRDVDFFVAATAGNVANLRRALKSLYDDDPNVEEILAEDLSGAYPAIEYIPPHGAYSLDILSRLGEAFRYETIESEELVLDGIRVRVATPAMLYRMKKDTVRPQDKVDALNLRRAFGLTDP